MNKLVNVGALMCLLSTIVIAEVFSPVELIKLEICPQQKDVEATAQCFKYSTFDIIAWSIMVEKSSQDNEIKAYANTKLGLIYEVNVGDKTTALSYYNKACSLGDKRGCLLAKGVGVQ